MRIRHGSILSLSKELYRALLTYLNACETPQFHNKGNTFNGETRFEGSMLPTKGMAVVVEFTSCLVYNSIEVAIGFFSSIPNFLNIPLLLVGGSINKLI